MNKRTSLIAAVAVTLAVIGAVAVIVLPLVSSNQKPTSVVSTPTPTPADAAKASTAPSYVGFDSFLDIGVTADQVMALKYALKKFVAAGGKSVKTVSISSVVAGPHDRNSANPISTATFKALLSGNASIFYVATLEYSDVSAIRLHLSDTQTGAPVYDSGLIDLSITGVGDN